ncbi:uncharacterized protein B0P05DRAFT_608252 [Gilbertella persicaria]|uniref:uncharacterized protein n=1 Tax=Gilbertella persicaria TaxID=101096 RepID=UPI0022206E62|nr:uncharacterized protein B0P05DRAFT_608252 [Gilbertella persicaria]KAI8086979.1 hypothetical protein B0P05DRAFT_608252 [Gilbertella persicaria]
MLSQHTIESVWNAFKTKRSNADLFTTDAVVMFVPSSVGARGNEHIRRFFLHPQFSDKVTLVQETVCHTVASNFRLIEEVVWSVQFFTDECQWLVPGIEDRYLMNAAIKFPVTISASFDPAQLRIESIRYSWDQACVLKQIRVISDKVKWPIVAEQQVDTLQCPDSVRLIGLDGQPIDPKKVSWIQLFIHFIQDGLVPGRIFGPVDPKDQVSRPVRHPEPNGPPNRNIFTYEPPAERRLVASSNKLDAQFSFAHHTAR